MDPTIIVLVIVGAIILLAAARFLGRTLRLVTHIVVVIIVLFAILSFITYRDFADLKKGLYENNNTFMLYDNNTLYAAVMLKPITNLSFTLESFSYFTKEELERMEQALNKKNYSELATNNYKLFIIKPELINKSYTLKLTADLNEKDIISMIMSDDPYRVVARKIVNEYNASEDALVRALESNYGSNERIKGYLFAAMLMNYYQSRDSSIIDDVRRGNMMIIPDLLSTKIIKYLPRI
jgi:hypothetical protein